MPTSCARLGRFMLTRYFSMSSPSCFCAPAVTPPTWFITLENSGDAIAWLAKELKPFSISPIIVCQITAGSLPLSAIDALPEGYERLPRFACLRPYHTVRPGRSTAVGSATSESLLRCDKPWHRVSSSRYHPGDSPP